MNIDELLKIVVHTRPDGDPLTLGRLLFGYGLECGCVEGFDIKVARIILAALKPEK